MYSAKHTARLYREWDTHSPDRATLVMIGSSFSPAEPLLLEALANHPGCKKLYFIPLDGKASRNQIFHENEVKHFEGDWFDWMRTPVKPTHLLGYDITRLLDRQGKPSPGSDAIEKKLVAHFHEKSPQFISSEAIDLFLAAHGEHGFDSVLVRRHRGMGFFNHPVAIHLLDDKTVLPALNEELQEKRGITAIAPSAPVHDLASLTTFMDTHHFNQVVLKVPNNCGGTGIYRIFRDLAGAPLMAEYPDRDFEPTEACPRLFPLTDDFFAENGLMLAMEWLDNSKGDIRVYVLNGKAVGAYKRMPSADSWLCNYAQGGSIEPASVRQDFSFADRRKLRAVTKHLAENYSIYNASLDWLANAKGERFLSEINIGNTDDLVEIDKHEGARNAAHGRLPIADQLATEILSEYLEMLKKDPAAQAHRTRSVAAQR